jgi:general secretion pathway protein G
MLSKKRKLRRQAGFTLVEIMAVTFILALLAGGAVLGINKMVQKARVNATISQIANFGSAISAFHLECGSYPTSLNDLITAPSGRGCKGYPAGGFLEKKEIPDDPWSTSYNFVSPGIHNPDGYDLWSNGPDKEDGTSDDVTNWSSESGDQT